MFIKSDVTSSIVTGNGINDECEYLCAFTYTTHVDIDSMNKGLHKIQILKDLELPNISHLSMS